MKLIREGKKGKGTCKSDQRKRGLKKGTIRKKEKGGTSILVTGRSHPWGGRENYKDIRRKEARTGTVVSCLMKGGGCMTHPQTQGEGTDFIPQRGGIRREIKKTAYVPPKGGGGRSSGKDLPLTVPRKERLSFKQRKPKERTTGGKVAKFRDKGERMFRLLQ